LKRLKIVGAVILFAAMAVFLLLPGSGSMERYEDMYQRGHYAQVSRGLQKELRRTPQWHEARLLLIEAELKQNRLESAVRHVLVLEGEKGFSRAVRQIIKWLEINEPSQDVAASVLNLLQQRLQEKNADTLLYELLLHMARYQDPSLIPEALRLALSAPIEFSEELENLFYTSMARIHSQGDIATLWDLAVEYDSMFHAEAHMGMRAYVVMMLSAEEVALLWQQHPGEALLAIRHAFMSEPTAGLELVREWEGTYTVDESSASLYANMKLAILAGVEHLEPGDFACLDSDRLMDLALSCTYLPAKCQFILDYLEEQNYDAEEIQTARGALSGLRPDLSLDRNVFSISPDGEKILCADGLEMYLLVGGRETKLADSLIPGVVYWSADSSHFVIVTETYQVISSQIINEEYGDGFLFSVDDGKVKELGFSDSGYNILGWKGPETLWLEDQYPRSLERYYEYNIKTDEILPSRITAPAWAEKFHPSPKGYVAWSSSRGFSMSPEEGPHELSGYFISWTPDGSGLLVDDGGFCVWSGDEPEPTGVEGQFLGWRNDRVFYWTPWRGKTLFSKLMGYDIESKEVIDYNAFGAWREANGNTAVAWNYVYLGGIISSRSDLHPTQPISLVYYIP